MAQKNAGEQLVKTWAEAQQQLLTDWLTMVRSNSGTPTLELWTKTMDAWQASVKDTLDTQTKWTHEWTERLANAKGTPEELRELAEQGREQLQRWTDTERQIWQGWFEIVRSINTRLVSGASAASGNDLVQLWQESAHKMIDTQSSLVRLWTSGFPGAKKDS